MFDEMLVLLRVSLQCDSKALLDPWIHSENDKIHQPAKFFALILLRDLSVHIFAEILALLRAQFLFSAFVLVVDQKFPYQRENVVEHPLAMKRLSLLAKQVHYRTPCEYSLALSQLLLDQHAQDEELLEESQCPTLLYIYAKEHCRNIYRK